MNFEPSQQDLPKQMPFDPRNPWSRLLQAIDALACGNLSGARDQIEGLRYHPDLPPEVLDLWYSHLDTALVLRGAPPPLNRPAEYTANAHGLFHPPFRQIQIGRSCPKPYPWAMALPAFTGMGNDSQFLDQAATVLEPRLARLPCRIEVVWTPDRTTPAPQARAALAQLLEDLSYQTPRTAQGVTVLGDVEYPQKQDMILRKLGGPVFGPNQTKALAAIVAGADMVVFLSGQVRLDPLALTRAARLVLASERAVLPLVPLDPAQSGALSSVYTPETAHGKSQGRFSSRYPFRDCVGLNLVMSARLLGGVGLPEGRFTDMGLAGRELAYRAFVRGAWFVPLLVPELGGGAAGPAPAAEVELYKALCPNHWDRKRDIWHGVPKVSVYIPAYNASKYIERAVDSVLAQDVADLDVCIANDGSRDGTLALLEQRYGSEKRVRWIDNPNGGIGFASNSAIRMSRSLYIGQLDSDDCLKPGAVRRLMEVLDENPNVVCAYGSCERIDAAGHYTQDEYSWPVFSREKMMITSIAHHFRMFRRQTWERTTGFREDIVNGVDYDIFLKMSELGEFRHIDEKLYQRRWHGENTSHVNEHHQTTNTHRVQRESLARQGLSRFWDVHVPDPDKPRNVTYRRRDGVPLLIFWPDYSQGNPYQRLLYAKTAARIECVAGDIDAALQVIASGGARAQDVIFHLHWLNALFRGSRSKAAAQKVAENFEHKLLRLRAAGARVVWTIHNHLSHDTPFPDVERALSARIAELADCIHLHSAGQAAELADVFALPPENIRIARHGHYIGVYSDIVPRNQARAALGIDPQDDVILFTGMIRPYKGVDQLITAFRRILADRPKALLVLAGLEWIDPLEEHDLSAQERARILRTGRFVADTEMQVFFRAADIAAYPYQRTLTSGSLMLALSFGVPVVVPHSAMAHEVLDSTGAGLIYPQVSTPSAQTQDGAAPLEQALRKVLAQKDTGHLAVMAAQARNRAMQLDWPDFSACLCGLDPVQSGQGEALRAANL